MPATPYIETLTDTVNELVDIRRKIFDLIFPVVITGELKEWSDSVPVGEQFEFTRELFEGCDDINVKKLLRLLNNIEDTIDSICNLNNIDFPKRKNENSDGE